MFETRSSEEATGPDDSAGELARGGPGSRGRVLVILHGEDSSAGRIGQLIERKGYSIERRKPRFGCPVPTTLDGFAGAVVFGGPMSANDADAWIAAEIELAALALQQDKPFLGVCLGAQMLAKALGARVDRHPEAHVEIGYYPIQPTAAGKAFGAWPERVYHWHREGFDVPAGAQLLATGGAFPNQAFTYGKSAGLQFHPEITYALVNRWTTDAASMLAEPGAAPAYTHREGHLAHARQVERWLSGFLDRWLAGAMQSV